MRKYRDLFVKIKTPIMLGIASLTVIVLGGVLLMVPLRLTSFSNSSKIAKLQCQEAGAMLSMKINASADIIRNYSYLIAHLAETDLVPKENKRAFMLSEMEIRYRNEKALNNLWCTFEPDALDGMDAQFIGVEGSNESIGVFEPWFADDKLATSTVLDFDLDYYSVPKETKQEAVTDPYWDEVNGKNTLMISFSAPVLLHDTVIGVVGTDFYIDDLNDLLTETQNIVGSGKLVTNNGIIVVHDDSKFIGEPEICDCYDIIMNRLLEGKRKMYDEFFKSSKKGDIYRVYTPVYFGRIEKPWVYIVEVPANQVYAEARKTIGVLGIIFVLLILSLYFYMKTIEKNRELKKMHRVKDKLFSIVAHELRSPMASLMTLLKMTNMKLMDIETQNKLLKDVSKRVDDVFGLLDNLLRWAKSQMQGVLLTPVYFDSQSEIRAVVDDLQIIANTKKIALKNRTEKQEIYADRDVFSVVLRNLSMNALKYTSAEGEITIDSELLDNMLVVSVKDTGIGMTKEVQDKLFNFSETRSQRGTDNESGTGLGLVLCADFVRANGGRIWFTSVLGEGSTFFFSVPVKH